MYTGHIPTSESTIIIALTEIYNACKVTQIKIGLNS